MRGTSKGKEPASAVVIPPERKIYCAYCGKSFTRKEHLERHLPSHTNVKPYRCSCCQLGFARRDLLQRHHATYHEAKDPEEPPRGGSNTIAGKTQIACGHCSQAKTGCDKLVPSCTRCREKGLVCEARFARRSTKAAARAAQAAQAAQANAAMGNAEPSTRLTLNPTPMDRGPGVAQHDARTTASPGEIGDMGDMGDMALTIDPRISQHDGPITMDPRISQYDGLSTIDPLIPQHDGPLLSDAGIARHDSPPRKASLVRSPPNIESLHDELFQMGQDFNPADFGTQDMFGWSGFPVEVGMYPEALSHVFGELSDISSSSVHSCGDSIQTRGTSIMSIGDFDGVVEPLASASADEIPEIPVVIAAESAWPLARCTPVMYSGSCPRTAIVHLECLEQMSKHEGAWGALEQSLRRLDWDETILASVVPINPRTRDKMLAITQTFLHKALEIHRGGVKSQTKQQSHSRMLTFLVLPPSDILEYLLRNYVRNLLFFYALVWTGCIDPNEMIQNNQATTLLVLLMIAQGASVLHSAEARSLSAGLIETCRISLFDIIEKDIEMCADPTVLRCALLFTLLGAWSGDKWLMDIAMGQRGMYLAMLKHAGMLDTQPPILPPFGDPANVELAWRTWLQRETQNRLVYNWAMVDQELSLFHDTAPTLAISDFCAPMPGPEILWMAKNADQWMDAMQSYYGCAASAHAQLLQTPSLTPSLHDLFRDFLREDFAPPQGSLTPHQLRLLLHPLQSMLCHLRQMLSCFSDLASSALASPRVMTESSTLQRLEEVQGLLQRWNALSSAYAEANPACAVGKANMVLYHLISLTAVTDFAEIERLARREGLGDGLAYWQLAIRYQRCVYQPKASIFHCGQVLRQLRDMPRDRQPSWWSAAVYRAILILWTDSVSRLDPGVAARKEVGSPVTIDQVPPDDAALVSYLWGGEGIPVLRHRPNSAPVSLDKPSDVLQYAVQMIEANGGGLSSRFADGIKRKLIALNRDWNVDELLRDTSGNIL